MSSKLISPKEYEENFVNIFLNIIRENKIIPKEIRIKDVQLLIILKPLAEILGIKLIPVKRLYSVEKAKKFISGIVEIENV